MRVEFSFEHCGYNFDIFVVVDEKSECGVGVYDSFDD